MSVITCKIIVFDLDDTLFDTSKWLLDDAIRDTCSFLSTLPQNNKNIDFFREQRASILNTTPRNDWILGLVKKNFPFHLWETIYHQAKAIFYERDIPNYIKLEDCVYEMLRNLCQKYKLYLVTQGNLNTQSKKIKILNISHLFSEIFIVPSLQVKNKGEAFQTIEKQNSGLEPKDFMSVGNRVDTDLAPAKALGWTTCWIDQGEHLAIRPVLEIEKPDYVLKSVCDIFKLWSIPEQVSYSFQMENHKF